jgi:hypothetical protein
MALHWRAAGPMFQGITAFTIDQRNRSESSDSLFPGMRLSWPEHLQTARTVELSSDRERGTALALMGVALLLLAQDLLEQESGPSDADRSGSSTVSR